MTKLKENQMQEGFYWYFEAGKALTVVLVNDDGVQFAGNDEYYQVAAPGIAGPHALRGQFVAPLVVPTR